MKKLQIRMTALAAAAALVALPAAMAVSAPKSSFSPTEEAAISRLLGQILETIQTVPTGARSAQYEAQIMLTIEQSEEVCPIVMASLDRAIQKPNPREAESALKTLQPIVDKCARGTGALSDTAFSAGPQYGVGGGGDGTSDYRP